MEFSFRYRVDPADLMVLSLLNIYRSMMGVVNIVFTLSMVLLAYRFWGGAGWPVRALITAGILLFPVIHPFLIFLRSRKIVRGMPGDMGLRIGRGGMDISSGGESSHWDFGDLKSVIRVSGMMIIYTRTRQGFILNSKVLDGKGKKLYDFLVKNVNR